MQRTAAAESDRGESEDQTPDARTVDVSPRGEHLAVGFGDGTVSLLDAETGEELAKLDPALQEALWVVAYSPDGHVLAGLGSQGSLRFWDPARPGRAPDTDPSNALVGIPGLARTHEWPFGARLLWAPSGDRLAILHSSGSGSLWTRAGECVARWKSSPRRTDHTAAWHRSESRLYLADEETLQVRDGATGEVLSDALQARDPIVTLALHPSKDLIATGHADYTMRIWSLESGTLQHEGRYPDPWLTEPEDEVCSIAWSPEGDRIALSIRVGTHAFVLDAQDMSTIWTGPFIGAHFEEPVPVRWSPDGSCLWYSFSCGKGPLYWVLPSPQSDVDMRLDARLPALGENLGATIIRGQVHAVSLRGDLLW